MQISSRFTIAVHVLICIGTFRNDYKITSDFLASSVNVNPVVIRRIIQQLKKAGIITVKRGSGGADIARPLDEISAAGRVQCRRMHRERCAFPLP